MSATAAGSWSSRRNRRGVRDAIGRFQPLIRRRRAVAHVSMESTNQPEINLRHRSRCSFVCAQFLFHVPPRALTAQSTPLPWSRANVCEPAAAATAAPASQSNRNSTNLRRHTRQDTTDTKQDSPSGSSETEGESENESGKAHNWHYPTPPASLHLARVTNASSS